MVDIVGNKMARKQEKGDEKEESAITPPQTPATQVQPATGSTPTAFQYIRSLGYANYTFANDFEYADLNTDHRSYPIAKKVNAMLIKEDNGVANYVGLAFVGILDDPLFLILMTRAKAAESSKKINAETDFVGLQFNGITKHFGNVALVAVPKDVYLKLADRLKQ
jgi:hypothetical protein